MEDIPFSTDCRRLLSIFHYGLINFGWSNWLVPCQGACHWPVKKWDNRADQWRTREHELRGLRIKWWLFDLKKKLIYPLGNFGPWNWNWTWNSIFLLLPIGRVSQIALVKVFWPNVFPLSNVSFWQTLPRFSHALPAFPSSRSKRFDPQHWRREKKTAPLCLADVEWPIFLQACSLHFQSTQGTFKALEWAKKGRLHGGYRRYHIFGKLFGYASNEILLYINILREKLFNLQIVTKVSS